MTIHFLKFSKVPTYRGLSTVSRDLLDGADKPRHVGIIEQLSTDPNTLHQQLKEKTKDIHSLLEEKSVFGHYMSKSLTATEYLTIIAQTSKAYTEWQRQLDVFVSTCPIDNFWQIDLKSELLSKELAKAPHVNVSGFNIPPLSLTNKADYLGCAYVFEGSKLGSRVIYKTLSHNENLKEQAFYYFKELSQQSTDRITWPQWINLFEGYARDKCVPNDAITMGALKCFQTLYDWFSLQRTFI